MYILKEQIDNYLSYCTHVRGFTKQTMQSKTYILKRFLQEINKDTAQSITNQDFDTWREGMIKSGVSPQTANTRSHHAIAFFKYLMDYRVDLNINLDIIHDIKHEQTEIGYYEKHVIEEAKKHCNGMMDMLALSIAYESGMRLSELTNIKVEDIYGTMIKVVGKGRKPRSTFVTPETARMIDKWISRNEMSEGYIFPSLYYFDKPISPYHMRYTLGKPFLKAGIKDFHPHKLRHSFATTLVENGADIITVQNLLGHTNIATTSKYLHTSNKRLESEYQRLMKPKAQ